MKSTTFLETFGLSKNDRAIYESLLRLGKAKTGEIIKDSAITSSRVYASLAILSRHGLVSSTVRNNIRYYKPEPPTQLLDTSLGQTTILQTFIENFSPNIPTNSSDRITVYEGDRGYRQAFLNHIQTAPAHSKFHIIGYGSTYRKETEVRSFFKKVDEQMAKNHSTANMIVDTSLLNTVLKDRKRISLYSFRMLPSKYFSAMAINISSVEVMFTIIGIHPIAICIRDQKIIEAFRKHFNLLWDLAKPTKIKSQ